MTYAGEGSGEPAIMTTDSTGCSSGYVILSDMYSANNAFNDNGNHSENADCNYVSSFNGTSSAAPMVSGVVALMLETNPALSWRDIKHLLATTARKVDENRAPITLNETIVEPGWTENAAGYQFHNSYGFGAVDAQAAVTGAQNFASDTLGTYFVTREVTSEDLNLSFDGLGDVADTLSVSEEGFIESVRIKLYATHTRPKGLSVALIRRLGRGLYSLHR